MKKRSNRKFTYQGNTYELPEYLELQLQINHYQGSNEPLIPLDSRIKNGRLWIDTGWVEPRGRFTFSEAPKLLGIFKGQAEYLVNIKIKPYSPVIKYFLDRVIAGPTAEMKKLFSLSKELDEPLPLARAKADHELLEHKRLELYQQSRKVRDAARQHYWKKESIEEVDDREMVCYLGKRHFNCDNEHFWYQIKKQLFHIINEN
jgi:hypothetical protein